MTPLLSGNFTWCDEFDGEKLSPLWIMIRQSHETWWAQENGELKLTPRSDKLSGETNPSFIARRLQHSRFETVTTLSVPTDIGVSAGLVVFQSETHHFYFGAKRESTGVTIFLERRNGSIAEILANATIGDASQLKLRLTGNEKHFAFTYAASGGDWQALAADVDSTPVTVQAAGGGLHFTGAVIGLHARLE